MVHTPWRRRLTTPSHLGKSSLWTGERVTRWKYRDDPEQEYHSCQVAVEQEFAGEELKELDRQQRRLLLNECKKALSQCHSMWTSLGSRMWFGNNRSILAAEYTAGQRRSREGAASRRRRVFSGARQAQREELLERLNRTRAGRRRVQNYS